MGLASGFVENGGSVALRSIEGSFTGHSITFRAPQLWNSDMASFDATGC
jgi:hypothetical protein